VGDQLGLHRVPRVVAIHAGHLPVQRWRKGRKSIRCVSRQR
jgi:hypothetical protein